MVVSQTASVIEALLNNLPRGELASRYLSSYTLDYLNRVQQGFHTATTSFRETQKAHVQEIISDGSLYLEGFDPELTEAFSHAMVVFAFMPELTRTSLHGFSRGGILRPPTTRLETLERIRELRTEVTKMISGQTQPVPIDRATHALLRTYSFFQTGKNLRVHQAVTPAEQDDLLNHLLDGIAL
jgi:hypothetical protein